MNNPHGSARHGRAGVVVIELIRLQLGKGPVRLWRDKIGGLPDDGSHLVTYRLCKGGSSDLIGLFHLLSVSDLPRGV